MIKLIKSTDYKIMPWKNGQGTTAEIEIFPENSNFAQNDFTYRLSSATVRGASPFSMFPGFERILNIFKGEGLILNGQFHSANTPFVFSGEIPMDCQTVGEEVTDVGLIFRRGKLSATMTIRAFAPHFPQRVSFAEGIHYLFCTEGSFFAQDLVVECGDTLKFENVGLLAIESKGGARCCHLNLKFKT